MGLIKDNKYMFVWVENQNLKRLATLYRDVIYRFNVKRVLLSRDKITRCVNVS